MKINLSTDHIELSCDINSKGLMHFYSISGTNIHINEEKLSELKRCLTGLHTATINLSSSHTYEEQEEPRVDFKNEKTVIFEERPTYLVFSKLTNVTYLFMENHCPEIIGKQPKPHLPMTAIDIVKMCDYIGIKPEIKFTSPLNN